jgi:alpha-tubulin suppressor-like RCC1 family protein
MSDDGKVLSWGHGGHGQLGHSSIQNQKVLLLTEALSNERVVYVTLRKGRYFARCPWFSFFPSTNG